jgi:cytochrome c553
LAHAVFLGPPCGALFIDEVGMKIVAMVCGVLIFSNSFADELNAGRAKAESACALCHGFSGIATMPGAPNLAGQQPVYLAEQLSHYRSGKRQHDIMGVIAKILTDLEISQLAAWYSGIKVTVEMPGAQ